MRDTEDLDFNSRLMTAKNIAEFKMLCDIQGKVKFTASGVFKMFSNAIGTDTYGYYSTVASTADTDRYELLLSVLRDTDLFDKAVKTKMFSNSMGRAIKHLYSNKDKTAFCRCAEVMSIVYRQKCNADCNLFK